MKHYSEEAWLDFTRRLLPAEETRRMQTHLDDGCEECGAIHRIWRAVWEVASKEVAYQPDTAVVDSAKAAYSRGPWKAAPTGIRVAMLVFDSFATAGATAGFRSISPAGRHLLYQAGALTVDVRLATYSGTGITIAGQVLKAGVRANAPTTEVSVTCGETTLARTVANEFGEFQLEVEDGPDLRIRLDVEQHAPIVLPLPVST